LGALKSIGQGGNQAAADGTALVGPIDGDDGRGGLDGVEGQRIAHSFTSPRRGRPASALRNVIGICNRARANVFPCVSMRSDWLAPPARTSYNTKFKACRFGTS